MKVNCVENIQIGHFLIRKMNNKLADISKVVDIMDDNHFGGQTAQFSVHNKNNKFNLPLSQLNYLMQSDAAFEVYSDIKDVMELYPEEFI
ncbi:hypothetical protein WCWAEYFT_CDS0149 [Vibrio phage VB_VaC_TDDLMA]